MVRGGREEEIALQQLVPGDVVRLSAGDMIPADVRLVASKDLFITQAALTGESLPVEKLDAPETRAGIVAAGIREYLLPRHECGKRHGDALSSLRQARRLTLAAWRGA